MEHEEDIQMALELLKQSARILVLTGAGVSAESGVPTFRGDGGAIWKGMPFGTLSSAEMVELDLPLVWEWFDYRRGVVRECRPNHGHRSIAVAQNSGKFEDFTLVTQNIDGLHAAAGSTDIIELHGSIHRARCLSCPTLQELSEIPEDERPPACPDCFDSMRPDVVLFGEAIDEDALLIAYEKAAACDVCIVVGTSAVVYPANQIPLIAKREGASVIEINPDRTELTPICDVSIRSTAAKALPELFGNQ